MGRNLTAVAFALVLGVAVGCGGDSNGSDASGSTETLKVSSPPILDAAPYFWALDTGMFRRSGLKIQDQTSTGGAADIPALVSGDIDLASSNTVSALLARSKGLPLTMVTGGAAGHGPHQPDSAPLMVAPDSPIVSPKQLAGKTVAVNTLNNINHIYAKAWLRRRGVDPDSIEFLEVSFPDQPPALLRGRVDAVDTVTPFGDHLRERGARVLGYPYQIQPRVFVSGWLTSERTASDRGDAIAKFRSVFTRAIPEVQDPANRKRLLTILERRTKIPVATLRKAVFPSYVAEPDVASLAKTGALMREERVAEIPDPQQLARQLVTR